MNPWHKDFIKIEPLCFLCVLCDLGGGVKPQRTQRGTEKCKVECVTVFSFPLYLHRNGPRHGWGEKGTP
jgi:hypothetical protein